MIFDLLTPPQGHQFDPRLKSLLAFCSTSHPHQFDMPHDHIWKKKFYPLGHDPGNITKIPFNVFYFFYL